ncbi:MAG: hypothetical protein COA52_19465 [Hyphomicrobiales bacterium]|nr:MAG: hypothetical protein COA52_19465 [Hyphomicrobiales bacterium]
MRSFLAILLAVLVLDTARAERIISALSAEKVEINSNFIGTDMVVFGSIERDAATVSRGAGYDIAIIMKGPPAHVVTRKKDRIFGIWINREARSFQSIPTFYALHSNKLTADLASQKLLAKKQIGMNNISFSLINGGTAQQQKADKEYIEAYRRLKANDNLFQVDNSSIDFLTNHLFKSTFHIPAKVPVGEYTIEFYLFNQGSLLAETKNTFQVSKAGFEQIVYDYSRNQSIAFGVVAVLLALFTGWFGGVIFRRD